MRNDWILDAKINVSEVCRCANYSRLAAIEALQAAGVPRADAEVLIEFQLDEVAAIRSGRSSGEWQDELGGLWDRLSLAE